MTRQSAEIYERVKTKHQHPGLKNKSTLEVENNATPLE